jgi:hypothetical protein
MNITNRTLRRLIYSLVILLVALVLPIPKLLSLILAVLIISTGFLYLKSVDRIKTERKNMWSLMSSETILLKTHRHWIKLLWTVVPALVVALALTGVAIVASSKNVTIPTNPQSIKLPDGTSSQPFKKHHVQKEKHQHKPASKKISNKQKESPPGLFGLVHHRPIKTTALALIPTVLALVFYLIALILWLRWKYNLIVITKKRLILLFDPPAWFLAHSFHPWPMRIIKSARDQTPLLGGLAHYGSILCATYSNEDGEIDDLHYIPRAPEVAVTLNILSDKFADRRNYEPV